MKLPFRLPFGQPEHDPADLSSTSAGDAQPAPVTDAEPDEALKPGDPMADGPSGEAAASSEPVLEATQAPASTSDTGVLLRVAEETWRLGRRIDRAANDVGEGQLEDVRDALQRLRDVLAEAGVEATSHDGERYRDGLRLHILHVEGEPGDDTPLRIVRTVRPSILVDGQVAVSGQVILGPAEQETTPP